MPRPASSPDSDTSSTPNAKTDRHSCGTSVHCPLCSMRIDRSTPAPNPFFSGFRSQTGLRERSSILAKSDLVDFGKSTSRHPAYTRDQSSLYITLNWRLEGIRLQRARSFSSRCLNICIDSNQASPAPLACRYANTMCSHTKIQPKLYNLELSGNKPPHCSDLAYLRADYPSACAHVRPHRYRQAPHHRLALRPGTSALSDRSP